MKFPRATHLIIVEKIEKNSPVFEIINQDFKEITMFFITLRPRSPVVSPISRGKGYSS